VSELEKLKTSYAEWKAGNRMGFNVALTLDRAWPELTRILDALPRTADGAIVVPGMTLHVPCQDESDYPDGIAVIYSYMLAGEVDCRNIHWSECYSTKEAARKAQVQP
jgi:hypothetical protein